MIQVSRLEYYIATINIQNKYKLVDDIHTYWVNKYNECIARIIEDKEHNKTYEIDERILNYEKN